MPSASGDDRVKARVLVRFVRGDGPCATDDSALTLDVERVAPWAPRAFIGVGRWAFLLLYRHEFHPAFRTISRMIGYDFGMHRAGVFLLLLLLACRAGGRRAGRRRVLAMGVLRNHRVGHRQHKCARDYG